MIAIHKYPFPIEDRPAVVMPRGARILKIECQGLRPCLWAAVDTDAPPVAFCFLVFGTGHPIPAGTDLSRLVATFQQGACVWHVFMDLGGPA